MRTGWTKILFFTLLIVTIDLAAKTWIQQNLKLYQEIEVIRDFFNINYLHNPGSAFGLFAKAPPLFRNVFFGFTTITAIIVIALLIYRSSLSGKAIETYALASILGGAIANGINRFHLGYVVDFLHLHWNYKYHFPSFNIADIAISVGVAVLILKNYFEERQLRSLSMSAKNL